MFNTLSIASDGYISVGRSTLAIASNGYLDIFKEIEIIIKKTSGGEGGGKPLRINEVKELLKQKYKYLDQAKIEDDEIFAILKMFIHCSYN